MDLKMKEKNVLEKHLEMDKGFVLEFTDKTFREFFAEQGIDIDNKKFHIYGTSKAKRMRAFWEISDNRTVANVLKVLADDWVTTSIAKQEILKISRRLISPFPNAGLLEGVYKEPSIAPNSSISNSSSASATIYGDGNVVNQTINNFGNDSVEKQLFDQIEKIALEIKDNIIILKAINEMKETVKTPNFKEKYKGFMSVISDHMTIFIPVLSELSKLL